MKVVAENSEIDLLFGPAVAALLLWLAHKREGFDIPKLRGALDAIEATPEHGPIRVPHIAQGASVEDEHINTVLRGALQMVAGLMEPGLDLAASVAYQEGLTELTDGMMRMLDVWQLEGLSASSMLREWREKSRL
jgi:hypothetical protein